MTFYEVVAQSTSGLSRTPLAYTPRHLAEKILTSKIALEGERKQVTSLEPVPVKGLVAQDTLNKPVPIYRSPLSYTKPWT
jgi:hypothetical protein